MKEPTVEHFSCKNWFLGHFGDRIARLRPSFVFGTGMPFFEFPPPEYIHVAPSFHAWNPNFFSSDITIWIWRWGTCLPTNGKRMLPWHQESLLQPLSETAHEWSKSNQVARTFLESHFSLRRLLTASIQQKISRTQTTFFVQHQVQDKYFASCSYSACSEDKCSFTFCRSSGMDKISVLQKCSSNLCSDSHACTIKSWLPKLQIHSNFKNRMESTSTFLILPLSRLIFCLKVFLAKSTGRSAAQWMPMPPARYDLQGTYESVISSFEPRAGFLHNERFQNICSE